MHTIYSYSSMLSFLCNPPVLLCRSCQLVASVFYEAVFAGSFFSRVQLQPRTLLPPSELSVLEWLSSTSRESILFLSLDSLVPRIVALLGGGDDLSPAAAWEEEGERTSDRTDARGNSRRRALRSPGTESTGELVLGHPIKSPSSTDPSQATIFRCPVV